MTHCKLTCFAKTLYRRALGKTTDDNTNEETRTRILEAAFDEIYENGFQGMRIDNVLKKTQLAKGALYHHFPSKKSLGYAVVDEVLLTSKKELLSALEHTDDPLTTCCEILQYVSQQVTQEEIVLGCPLNNLTQEMAGLDQGFHERLSAIYDYWQATLADALKRGQAAGNVKNDLDADTVATFIISSIQGIVGTVKCMQSIELLKKLNHTLCDYFESLRP